MDESQEISSVLGKLRLQDVIVIAVCCSSVFIFQVPYSYDLKPSWRLHLEESVEKNKSVGLQLITQAIVDDLDADGTNELVISSEDGYIKVHTFPSEYEIKDLHSSVLPHLNLKSSFQVEVSLSYVSKRGIVVSMSSGCARKSERPCEKILAVLTQDLKVHCFDAKLKLLWTKELYKTSFDLNKMYFRESSILVTSQKIPSDKEGLIFIVISLDNIQHVQHEPIHDHKEKFTPNQTTKELIKNNRGIDPAVSQDSSPQEDVEVSGHFMVFSLSAKTGEIIWEFHSGDNAKQNKQLEKLLFSGHHFKLQLHHQTYHKNEVPWTKYSKSFLSILPHHWDYPADTSIQLNVLHKDRHQNAETTGNNFFDSLKKSLGQSSDIPFLPKGSRSQSDPNAAIVHSERGVDVFNLSTGQYLCKLESKGGSKSLGDINGDGVLDYVEANFKPNHNPTDIPYCYAVVTSDHSKPVFNGSICHPSYLFDWLEGPEETSRDELSSLSPLLVPDVHSRNGIFNHLMGHTLPRPTQGFDSIFFISNGKVTCYGSHGEYHWQAVTTAFWPGKKFPQKSGQSRDFLPSIRSISLQSQSLQDSVVVTGWSNMAVLSLSDGRILAEHSLPCQPINPVLTGDFNNDGWTDLIIHCKQGYFGFTILRYHGYWYTAAFVGVILVVMVSFVSLLRYIDIEDISEPQPRGPKVS